LHNFTGYVVLCRLSTSVMVLLATFLSRKNLTLSLWVLVVWVQSLQIYFEELLHLVFSLPMWHLSNSSDTVVHLIHCFMIYHVLTWKPLRFQIRDQACQGHAALWSSWNWKDSYGTSNWKNFEWQGTEGLETTPYICIII
jgi:hypothetical protein